MSVSIADSIKLSSEIVSLQIVFQIKTYCLCYQILYIHIVVFYYLHPPITLAPPIKENQLCPKPWMIISLMAKYQGKQEAFKQEYTGHSLSSSTIDPKQHTFGV